MQRSFALKITEGGLLLLYAQYCKSGLEEDNGIDNITDCMNISMGSTGCTYKHFALHPNILDEPVAIRTSESCKEETFLELALTAACNAYTYTIQCVELLYST